jgi:hypothetical protein
MGAVRGMVTTKLGRSAARGRCSRSGARCRTAIPLAQAPLKEGAIVLLLAAYTVWIVVPVWRCTSNVEKPMDAHMAKPYRGVGDRCPVTRFPWAPVPAGRQTDVVSR